MKQRRQIWLHSLQHGMWPAGLAQHTSAFEADGYTLESLLEAVKQGDEAAMRDLREIKLNLGECRRLIAQTVEEKHQVLTPVK